MRRLILFDVDGTLLTTGGAAARAFRRALRQVFGTPGVDGYSFAGRTDPQIATELLSAAGVPEARIATGLPALWAEYLRELPGELERSGVRVLPGVAGLLDRLHEHDGDCAVGLLTGNIEAGARLKLGAAGLDFRRFVIGAYGSDHPDRRELPAVALRRAQRRLGRDFAGKSIVIVGDTPHDIACGERLGVRTIAVATGTYSMERLEACAPDYLFETLESFDAVCAAIFA